MRLWRERALPDLGNNIKCGNSLIGPDIYEPGSLRAERSNPESLSLRGADLSAEARRAKAERRSNPVSFTPDARDRINAFDWPAEFPSIFPSPPGRGDRGEGGFDVVIGNPPYVRQESLSDFKRYFEIKYEAYDGVADLYIYFMEQGVKLLRDGGLFSIIVSSSFLRATYGEPLRRSLKKHTTVLRIVDFGGLAIFANAKDTYVCIPLLQKGGKQARVEVAKMSNLDFTNLADHVSQHHFTIPSERLSAEAWALKSDEEAAVFAKITKAGKPLDSYAAGKMFYGLKTGFNEAFEVSDVQRTALTKSSPDSKALIKPFLGGQNIRRYCIEDEGRYLIVIPCGWTRQQMVKAKIGSSDFSEREAWNWFSHDYPKIAEHLAAFSDALRKRQDKGDYWWELRPCDYYKYFEAPKIIFPDICKGPRFYLDHAGYYLSNTAYCLGAGDLYLLGILNSRLFWFAISNISIPFGVRAGEYRYRLIYQYMEKVPIRAIDSSKAADKIAHDQMVSLVKQMLDIQKRLAAAKNPDEKIRLERQIKSTDDQIDRLVYELYGLTEEEIRIVERTTK